MNKGCFKCHEPERETVFELDETSQDRAQTLLKSPDFQKVVNSPDLKDFQKAVSGKPDFDQGLVSEKPVTNDDLYSLRPMKVATPIRVSNQPHMRTSPSGGGAVGSYAAQLPNGAFDGPPDAAQYDLSAVGMSQLQIDRFLKEPGDLSSEDALARDVRGKHEELLRTKQLSEVKPEQQNAQGPMLGVDDAASSSIQASEGHDAAAKDREDRKLKLKAEVAALREQVMKAKAARVERANSVGSAGSSLEKEVSVAGSTVASTDDVDGQPVDVAPPGPDLWGSRRRIPSSEEQQQSQDLKRDPRRCISGGGTDRLCFPARQCA